ncbi:MAG: hypothetical protein GY940_45845, partial [bacterium]|nr:hypothetical protein [bacterium]
MADGIKKLLNEPYSIFVPVSPVYDCHLDSLLMSPDVEKDKNKNPDQPGHLVINLLKPPAEEMPYNRFLSSQVGQLWLSGVDIDWSGYDPGQKRYRIPLPTYPFEEQPYRIEGNPFQLAAQRIGDQASPWRKPDVVDWFYVPSWKRSIMLPPGNSVPP